MGITIVQKFENWVSDKNNYTKLTTKGENSKFQFLDKNLSQVPSAQKASIYQQGVLNFAQSRIGLNDTDKNGSMNLKEYVSEQVRVYEKMYGQKLDMSNPQIQELFKKHFGVTDMDKNGEISSAELATTIAYMDMGQDSKLDGEISYKDAIGTNWLHKDMPKVLQNIKGFLFPENK